VRYGTALIAVLLVLLFAVRPLIGKLRGKGEPAAAPAADGTGALALTGDDAAADAEDENGTVLPGASGGVPLGDLPRQVELARRLAVSQPDRAVEALQRMLAAPDDTPDTTGAEPSAT
jgi:flagellar M-ring protein FliF